MSFPSTHRPRPAFLFPIFHTFHHQQDSVRDSDGGGGGVLAAADGRTNKLRKGNCFLFLFFTGLFFSALALALFPFFRACLVLAPSSVRGWSGGMDGRTDWVGLVWFGLVLAAAARRRVSFSFFSSSSSFFCFCFLFLSYHSLPFISISFDFLSPTSLFSLFFSRFSLLVAVGVVSAVLVVCARKSPPRSPALPA